MWFFFVIIVPGVLVTGGHNMDKILSSLFVLVASIIKFSAMSLVAIATNLGLGGALANIIGGIIGIVLFTYLGGVIQGYFIERFPKYFGRKFTRTNRFLVWTKQKLGLGGVAVFTPIILSIPVGVMFALTLTHDKRKIMVSMIISTLFWAAVLFLPYFVFNINIISFITTMVEGH